MKKIKITKIDSMFSKWIRTRDNWTCQRCGKRFTPPTSGLHCAHFIGRGRKSTRFDPDNCISACYGCHSFLDGAGKTEFEEIMKEKLGKKKYNRLIKKGQTTKSETEAKKEALELLN